MPRSLATFLALLLSLSSSVVGAQTLRWATRSDSQSMDPQAALESVTLNISQLVFDPLVELDARGRPSPALATGWTLVEPTLWRFALRPGVHFHDGTPFTADDAVFSIERAQQPSSKFASYAVPLGKVTRVDDLTIELRQARPDPLLLERLPYLFMMSRDWAIAHQAARVPDLKSGQEAYSNRHAMGTGRYRLEQYEPGVRTLLSRNTSWWGHFDGNVQQVISRPVVNDATRTAALLAGDFDFVQGIAVQDVQRLAAMPSIHLVTGPETRLIFLGLDQQRDRLTSAPTLPRNPFKDRRVREAMFLAIDVEALKRNIMRGLSIPTACIAASADGCLATSTDKHPPIDLERARRLLREAGYPGGFSVTLDCPNDRYVNDRAICVAVAGMLAHVGIDVQVSARIKAEHFGRLQRLDTSFYLHGWGTIGADAQPLLDALAHSPDVASRKGDANYGRFTDPALDRLLDAAGVEMDPKRRATLLREAQQQIADQHYLLPIHRQMLAWAARRGVHVVMTPDDLVRVDRIHIDE
jgi:peptide/nickel transport system substrate-binding protein